MISLMNRRAHTQENNFVNHINPMLQYQEDFLNPRYQEDQ